MIQHHDKRKSINKLTIIGDTEFKKPLINFEGIFKGLINYAENHRCDSDESYVHKNYLGIPIMPISINQISDNMYTAYSALSNGYLHLMLIGNKLILDFFVLIKFMILICYWTVYCVL